ncbi:hypothetical protein M501DRAFT_1013265 [Patellaria atrata CBS 101060]|uniref:Uncharacterized protein n=1 Tax=Patellaria atrata CBS 101060 TaxID=1346257 RepID=A0A9P4SHG7_9PEZI|nr:hypothetical protein M501DRAFT_1013265 [Patellaria atrata CBS 101060]
MASPVSLNILDDREHTSILFDSTTFVDQMKFPTATFDEILPLNPFSPLILGTAPNFSLPSPQSDHLFEELDFSSDFGPTSLDILDEFFSYPTELGSPVEKPHQTPENAKELEAEHVTIPVQLTLTPVATPKPKSAGRLPGSARKCSTIIHELSVHESVFDVNTLEDVAVLNRTPKPRAYNDIYAAKSTPSPTSRKSPKETIQNVLTPSSSVGVQHSDTGDKNTTGNQLPKTTDDDDVIFIHSVKKPKSAPNFAHTTNPNVGSGAQRPAFHLDPFTVQAYQNYGQTLMSLNDTEWYGTMAPGTGFEFLDNRRPPQVVGTTRRPIMTPASQKIAKPMITGMQYTTGRPKTSREYAIERFLSLTNNPQPSFSASKISTNTLGPPILSISRDGVITTPSSTLRDAPAKKGGRKVKNAEGIQPKPTASTKRKAATGADVAASKHQNIGGTTIEPSKYQRIPGTIRPRPEFWEDDFVAWGQKTEFGCYPERFVW